MPKWIGWNRDGEETKDKQQMCTEETNKCTTRKGMHTVQEQTTVPRLHTSYHRWWWDTPACPWSQLQFQSQSQSQSWSPDPVLIPVPVSVHVPVPGHGSCPCTGPGHGPSPDPGLTKDTQCQYAVQLQDKTESRNNNIDNTTVTVKVMGFHVWGLGDVESGAWCMGHEELGKGVWGYGCQVLVLGFAGVELHYGVSMRALQPRQSVQSDSLNRPGKCNSG